MPSPFEVSNPFESFLFIYAENNQSIDRALGMSVEVFVSYLFEETARFKS